MRTTKEILIANIKALRIERHWSQMRLDEEASLSTGMIGDIETGKKIPSLETMDKIATAFKVPTYHLLKDYDQDAKDERIRSNREKMQVIREMLGLLDLD